jgi:hypothetical protein
VQLRLGVRRVQGRLQRHWPRKGLQALAERALEPSAGAPPAEAGGEALSQAVEQVLAELAAAAPTRGCRLEVELADPRVRYDLVAGAYGGASERQLQAIATACMAELLGDAAADQSLCWHLQPDLQHLLVCAIERGLLDALARDASRHGLALASLQPTFCRLWNRHAGALPAGLGVFGVAAEGHATVAVARRGGVAALSGGPCPDDDPAAAALDGRVDRLLASVGIDGGEVSAFMLAAGAVAPGRLAARWTVLQQRQGIA